VHPGAAPSGPLKFPSWRDDLDRPIDLVEEVLRLHGTERSRPPVVSSPGLPPTTIRSWSSTAASPTIWSGTISTSA
jgi:phenylalanyl-tRNA synthetase beta subunit